MEQVYYLMDKLPEHFFALCTNNGLVEKMLLGPHTTYEANKASLYQQYQIQLADVQVLM